MNLKKRIERKIYHSLFKKMKNGHLFLSIFENNGKPMTQKYSIFGLTIKKIMVWSLIHCFSKCDDNFFLFFYFIFLKEFKFFSILHLGNKWQQKTLKIASRISNA